MSTLPGLESFELVSDESKTRVPLSGALLGWSDDVQHRLNEHAILQRSGSIHQSQGQGPRRFVFRCLLREPGASDTYKRVEALLGREPFATLLHPRFSRVPVVFVGLKVAEDMEARTSGMIVELSLCETGLREVKADSASAAARQASQATAQAVSLTQALPALAPLAQALAAQASAFLSLVEATTSQYDLAQALAAVRVAADSLVLAAGVTVRRFPIVAAARLALWQCQASYRLAGAQLPPIVPRTVPQRMSLARFARSLYGGGAQAMEAEIARINRIANPYAIPAGTVLQVADPARVTITATAAATATGETPNAEGWAVKDSPTTRGRLTWVWDSSGNLVSDDKAGYAVLMSIIAHKGAYRWDRTYGTLLHRLTRSRSTTGSQLAAYARDGGAQVEAAGLASGVTPRATRLASGRWRLAVRWTVAGVERKQEMSI